MAFVISEFSQQYLEESHRVYLERLRKLEEIRASRPHCPNLVARYRGEDFHFAGYKCEAIEKLHRWTPLHS